MLDSPLVERVSRAGQGFGMPPRKGEGGEAVEADHRFVVVCVSG